MNDRLHRITDEEAARMIREADDRDMDALRKAVASYDAHMDRLGVPRHDDPSIWALGLDLAAGTLFLGALFLACFVVMP